MFLLTTLHSACSMWIYFCSLSSWWLFIYCCSVIQHSFMLKHLMKIIYGYTILILLSVYLCPKKCTWKIHISYNWLYSHETYFIVHFFFIIMHFLIIFVSNIFCLFKDMSTTSLELWTSWWRKIMLHDFFKEIYKARAYCFQHLKSENKVWDCKS